jgi:N-carbamoylputrescine amidase
MIAQAGDMGAEYVVVPELFNRWFFPALDIDTKFYELAEPIPGYTTDRLGEVGRQKNMWIVGSVYEKTETESLNYNTLALISPTGQVVGKYRKMHIPMIKPKGVDPTYQDYEKFYYAPGDLGFPVFVTDKLKLGMAICYDRNFPETWRCLTLNGAEVVFLSVTSFGWRKEIYQMELRIHAYEQGLYIIGVNRVGDEGPRHCYGSSVIVDPAGNIVAGPGSDTKDDIVYAQIDMDKVAEARRNLTYLRDRRPDAYQALLGMSSDQRHVVVPKELIERKERPELFAR